MGKKYEKQPDKDGPGERLNFTKNDSGFTCAHCGKAVEPLRSSSRDHCPFCLYSLHLDIIPGDRASACGGELEPVAAELDARRGYMIIYRCKKCGMIKRNKAAHEAKIQPDNIELLIALTAKSGDTRLL